MNSADAQRTGRWWNVAPLESQASGRHGPHPSVSVDHETGAHGDGYSKMLRVAALAAALVIVATISCTSQAPPRVVISYSTTPMPAEFTLPTPSPTSTRGRRATPPPTAAPSPRTSTIGTTSIVPGSATAVILIETSTPRAFGSVAGRSTPPAPSETPTSIPGQVPEAQGAFVTSSSRGSRYYYTRDDEGWHRIQPENRIWFLTAEALLRAFPDRVLHGGATPTPTRSPPPTATAAPA